MSVFQFGRRPGFLPVSASVSLLFFSACCLLPLGRVKCESPPRQNRTWPTRVFPGMASFPSRQEMYETLEEFLDHLIYPPRPLYANATSMYNERMIRFPMYILYARSLEQVQQMLVFAKKHNLMLVIRSSGHCYIGRSTHDGGVVINLQEMKGKQFRLDSGRGPAGEVTVESGNTWLEVYRALDQQVTHDGQGRVVVGASAHTVAIGGYTLGGGHSPVCRRLGMAVDNLLEATLLLADGRKAVVNAQGTTITDLEDNTDHSNDTSLFWAIRGGGGGTFGIVTDFTFKLHFAPQRFRRVYISWGLYSYNGQDVGSHTIKHVLQQLSRLSNDWGGYMLVHGMPLKLYPKDSLTLLLDLFLNHFGSDDSPSNSEVDSLLDYFPEGRHTINDTRFDTFLDYEETVWDPPPTHIYIYNTFIHNETISTESSLDSLVEFLMSIVHTPTPTSIQSCTGTLIGGAMKEVAEGTTPVNPKFRSGLLSMSCSLSWSDIVHQDDMYVGKAMEMRDKLMEQGEGVYFNEPAEDLDDWKTQFWGSPSTYQRLLDVKKTWDPDNFFWCHNCVGSDLNQTYTGPTQSP